MREGHPLQAEGLTAGGRERGPRSTWLPTALAAGYVVTLAAGLRLLLVRPTGLGVALGVLTLAAAGLLARGVHDRGVSLGPGCAEADAARGPLGALAFWGVSSAAAAVVFALTHGRGVLFGVLPGLLATVVFRAAPLRRVALYSAAVGVLAAGLATQTGAGVLPHFRRLPSGDLVYVSACAACLAVLTFRAGLAALAYLPSFRRGQAEPARQPSRAWSVGSVAVGVTALALGTAVAGHSVASRWGLGPRVGEINRHIPVVGNSVWPFVAAWLPLALVLLCGAATGVLLARRWRSSRRAQALLTACAVLFALWALVEGTAPVTRSFRLHTPFAWYQLDYPIMLARSLAWTPGLLTLMAALLAALAYAREGPEAARPAGAVAVGLLLVVGSLQVFGQAQVEFARARSALRRAMPAATGRTWEPGRPQAHRAEPDGRRVTDSEGQVARRPSGWGPIIEGGGRMSRWLCAWPYVCWRLPPASVQPRRRPC